MSEINGETHGKIFLNKMDNIEFNQIYRRRVTRSNDTSGKVNLPVTFIGQEVLVAVPKKKLKRNKKK
jgi:putative transposon-encoded protein